MNSITTLSNLIPVSSKTKSQHTISPLFNQQIQIPPQPQYQLNDRFTRLYQLMDRIGCGGCGFVMSALHRATKQEVAVKFIYKKKIPASSITGGEPFEVNILKHINHPTVIGYIDSFEDNLYFYLVMELYGCEWKAYSHQSSSSSLSSASSPITPNEEADQTSNLSAFPPIATQRRIRSCDLFECIERHTKLSESQAHKIFRQIVQCIDDLSTIGIYHRDIKDENIVVDSQFKVKIIDFGSAIRIPEGCSRDTFTTKEFYGTLSFASPEILLGLSYRPEPAEVWSLGILLFTLLYGQVPFSNSNQVISGKWNRPVQPKSPECMNLLNSLLKNKPQKRLTVKQILQHPWMSSDLFEQH